MCGYSEQYFMRKKYRNIKYMSLISPLYKIQVCTLKGNFE